MKGFFNNIFSGGVSYMEQYLSNSYIEYDLKLYFFLPQTHQTFSAQRTSVSSQTLNPHKLK